jgi:hypothetical protein
VGYFIGIEVLEKMSRDTRMDAVEGLILRGGNSTLSDSLAKSEYSPFLLLFGLFFAGFTIFTGGMLLIVLRGRLTLSLFGLVLIVGIIIEVSKKYTSKNHRDVSRCRIRNKTEKWVIMLGWCIPQKHREAIVGDIIEDCYEMRKRGLAERNIYANTLWQWVISVVTLIPACVVGSIKRLLGAR